MSLCLFILIIYSLFHYKQYFKFTFERKRVAKPAPQEQNNNSSSSKKRTVQPQQELKEPGSWKEAGRE